MPHKVIKILTTKDKLIDLQNKAPVHSILAEVQGIEMRVIFVTDCFFSFLNIAICKYKNDKKLFVWLKVCLQHGVVIK